MSCDEKPSVSHTHTNWGGRSCVAYLTRTNILRTFLLCYSSCSHATCFNTGDATGRTNVNYILSLPQSYRQKQPRQTLTNWWHALTKSHGTLLDGKKKKQSPRLLKPFITTDKLHRSRERSYIRDGRQFRLYFSGHARIIIAPAAIFFIVVYMCTICSGLYSCCSAFFHSLLSNFDNLRNPQCTHA